MKLLVLALDYRSVCVAETVDFFIILVQVNEAHRIDLISYVPCLLFFYRPSLVDLD